MCKLHRFLIEKGFAVPNIIKTNRNNDLMEIDKNHYGVIYSFLVGNSISTIWQTVDPEFVKMIAREIRKFHDSTKNNNSFHLEEAPFQLPKELERKSVLHFDLTKSNIFINHSIGFIDFDDAKYGPSIVDVGIICSHLFISKKRGLDQTRMNVFLEEYYKNNTHEKEKEIKYLKEITLSWIQYIMNNHSFDTSTTDSFEVKKKIIENEWI